MTTGRNRAPTRGGRSKFALVRRRCSLCINKGQVVDYKNPSTLRPFISERAKIDSRRRTGTCAKHQRVLAQAIKRARHLALLPFTAEHIRKLGGIGSGTK